MSVKQALKLSLLAVFKVLGGFHLARALTRRRLRILCYHGFSIDDEDTFRPALFMPVELLAERIMLLKSRDFPVLPLGEALERQHAGTLPANAVVITIDDGWYSTCSLAAPILKAHDVPATLYVTTYYVQKPGPVFRVCIAYLFFKTKKRSVDLSSIGVPALTRRSEWRIEKRDDREAVKSHIIEFGENECDEDQRVALSQEVADALEVDYRAIFDSRMLSLANPDELASLQNDGIDLELHTHRHHLPITDEQVKREIDDNRAVLEPITGRTLEHFCYPSGEWAHEHWQLLENQDIVSATTSDPGFVCADTPRLALNRFLDHAELTQLEFEAEVYGVREVMRRLASVFKS